MYIGVGSTLETGVAGAVMLLLGVALQMGVAEGNSQLILEQSFRMETATCEGVSCRRQLIGGAEAYGLGAHTMCTSRTQYVNDTSGTVAPNSYLFELVYSCQTAEGESLDTEAECGASVCVDAATDPTTSEITYQIAFEHTELDYDVMVNMRLYFSYMTVNHDLYAMRAAAPPTCWLGETCHRACGSDEHQLDVVLGDTVGDGWNAGSLGLYNHFYFGSRASTMSVTEGARTGSSVTTAEVVPLGSSYTNTLLGGFARTVPLCLSNGEYVFYTELLSTTPNISHVTQSGKAYSESTWTLCGLEGVLSDYTHLVISDGACVPTDGFTTASPATTPAPTGNIQGTSGEESEADGSGDDDTVGAIGSRAEGDSEMATWKLVTIGCATFGAALLAAGGAMYAQNKGWFAAGAGAGAPGAAGGQAPNAPDPNVDEFAP